MKKPVVILSLIALLLSACSGHKRTPGLGELNTGASLPESFNFTKMGLKFICATVNKKNGTTSLLYGTDPTLAVKPGAVFALITWTQQPDPRWIGANIPGRLVSVEMLKDTTYRRFIDADLEPDPDTSGQNERTDFILGLRPAILF